MSVFPVHGLSFFMQSDSECQRGIQFETKKEQLDFLREYRARAQRYVEHCSQLQCVYCGNTKINPVTAWVMNAFEEGHMDAWCDKNCLDLHRGKPVGASSEEWNATLIQKLRGEAEKKGMPLIPTQKEKGKRQI